LILSREKAVKASKDKSDFLSNMSQKIGAPMKAISELANLAMKTELSEKQSYYLNKIKTSADSLSGIIYDILEFSKIEAGKESFK
jgi:two-component system, sensor histidine kinase and response regulator